uniref:G protein signaling modulator 3 n=1 Tax=Chlorocebus sabaeus TaxID=60711 RepID=A0A0D9RAE5_CHLSB
MEAERPQEEEDGEQGPPRDEQGWPPPNSTTRPWRSAPPSPPPPGTRHTALGPRSASLLSLQTELLLDLVAEAQSRRLEEQRATFFTPQNPPSRAPAPLRPLEDREQLYSTILSHQVRHPPRRQTQASWSLGPVLFWVLLLLLPRHPITFTGFLYASPYQPLILSRTSSPPTLTKALPLPPLLQCQRMEAQRSEPPLPPGGQELLELLLRVQGGGRMEEQRSRPPTHTC